MAYAYTSMDRGGWDTKQVEHYLPLVRRIAGRLAMALPSHVDEDDLIGYGVFGLLDAMKRFDIARGVKFETYATLRIRGSIIDGLRAMDWVPHSARQKVKQVQDAYGEMEMRLGRPAGMEEVAGFLAVDVKEIEGVLLQSQMLMLTSLDEAVTGEDGDISGSALDLLQDTRAAEAFEEVDQRDWYKTVVSAIEMLPEKEQMVLALYYQEELTLKEIAKVLKLSESRISQLHSQAILRLRGRLSKP